MSPINIGGFELHDLVILSLLLNGIIIGFNIAALILRALNKRKNDEIKLIADQHTTNHAQRNPTIPHNYKISTMQHRKAKLNKYQKPSKNSEKCKKSRLKTARAENTAGWPFKYINFAKRFIKGGKMYLNKW
jgi:hypothetical protein